MFCAYRPGGVAWCRNSHDSPCHLCWLRHCHQHSYYNYLTRWLCHCHQRNYYSLNAQTAFFIFGHNFTFPYARWLRHRHQHNFHILIHTLAVSSPPAQFFIYSTLAASSVPKGHASLTALHTGQNHAAQPLGFWELLEYIVHEPPPTLSSEDGFSPELCDFVSQVWKRFKKWRHLKRWLLA